MKGDLAEEDPQGEARGWGPKHVVHSHLEWNEEEYYTNDENEAIDDDKDLVDDNEHDMYLDWVPLEEEDGPMTPIWEKSLLS